MRWAWLERLPHFRGVYRPAGADAGCDYESRDGTRVLEVKERLLGVRDLHAALFRLAQVLSEKPKIRQACLLTEMPKMGAGRLTSEWRSLQQVFHPKIAQRLALVVVGPGGPAVFPEQPELRRLAEALPKRLIAAEGGIEHRPPRPGVTFFEVFKILLDQWLRQRGPLTVTEIVKRSGYSYPTVAEAVRRLESSNEILRRSRRSVELADFPRQTWGELLALRHTLRPSKPFVDPTGRPPDPQAVLRRLRARPRQDLALGGVIAARHWDPAFDLHGIPRLDLCITRTGTLPGEDLGLVPGSDKTAPERAIVVLHVILRNAPLFEADPHGGIPWADPVETLLDLHELKLVAQTEHLIERLRKRHP